MRSARVPWHATTPVPEQQHVTTIIDATRTSAYSDCHKTSPFARLFNTTAHTLTPARIIALRTDIQRNGTHTDSCQGFALSKDVHHDGRHTAACQEIAHASFQCDDTFTAFCQGIASSISVECNETYAASRHNRPLHKF